MWEATATANYWLLFLVMMVGTGSALALVNNLGQMVGSLGGTPGAQAPFVALFSIGSAAGAGLAAWSCCRGDLAGWDPCCGPAHCVSTNVWWHRLGALSERMACEACLQQLFTQVSDEGASLKQRTRQLVSSTL
jgi:hypothetical protein